MILKTPILKWQNKIYNYLFILNSQKLLKIFESLLFIYKHINNAYDRL
jgi:hypothetical protein